MAEADNLYRQVLAEWLQVLPWDYFLTVTFKRPENRADRAVDRVKEHLLGYPARAFLASETHQKGDYHVHGLFRYSRTGGPAFRYYNLSAESLYQGLFTRFGRSRVELVESPIAVSLYCAKYVVKAMSYYDFAGDSRHW